MGHNYPYPVGNEKTVPIFLSLKKAADKLNRQILVEVFPQITGTGALRKNYKKY